MSKSEVRDMVGGFLSYGMDYDESLQEDENNKYDEEASACANKFADLCEGGMNRYEAFVKAFFSIEGK